MSEVNPVFQVHKEHFDKQVEGAQIPDDFTIQDVYDFVVGVYSFTIPDGKEPGESPFGLLDYYNMESIGAFLKKIAAELTRLQAIEAAAREVLERFEWYKKLAEEGKGVSDSGYLSVSVMTLWDKQDQLAYDALAAALTQPGDGGEG
jgi:hypothetical protein